MGKGKRGDEERKILAQLDPVVVESARRRLEDVVARSGGTSAPGPVAVDGLEAVAALFQAWAEHLGASDDMPPGHLFRFESQPGLWRALQALVPLGDPYRWDPLRAAALKRLESMGWIREMPLAGACSGFRRAGSSRV